MVADLVAFACMLMCNLAIRETHNIFVKGDESGEQLFSVLNTSLVSAFPVVLSGSSVDGVLHHSRWNPARCHVVGTSHPAEHVQAAASRI